MPNLPSPLNVVANRRISDEIAAAIRELSGVRLTHAHNRDDAYANAIPDAHVICDSARLDSLADAKNLLWLQSCGAGIVRYAKALPDDVMLTNAAGIYAIPIAEHTIGMMVTLARGFDQLSLAKQNRQWANSDIKRTELFNSTCAIVGVGGIGSEIAKRAKAFGMRVVGSRRHPENPCLHVDEMYPHDNLAALLSQADHVVNALPGTDHTHHTFNAETFMLFKHGSYFYNVGRGSTVDEAALISVLKSGRLAGAGLDVFETEPLPQTSELWDLPNVFISPHRSGDSPGDSARLGELFFDNLNRFIEGKLLINEVDRALQY